MIKGKNIEAGYYPKPASLISIYFILIALDLITTYFCSPDLKLEGNFIFKALKVNWTGLILIYLSIAVICSVGYFIGIKYLNAIIFKSNSIGINNTFFEVIRKPRLLLSVIFIGAFYSHIINIGHVVLNNIIVLLYLRDVQFFLSEAVKGYIKFQNYFRIYYQTIPILIGYFIAYQHIRYIKNQRSGNSKLVNFG